MKTFLFILTVLCGALAEHHGHGQSDPCLVQCRDQAKSKASADPDLAHFKPEDTAPGAAPKFPSFIRDYVRGIAPPASVGTVETWTKLCTISTEAETCINACADSPKKEGAKKFLTIFKLGCDQDFKSQIVCLVDARKQASETCDTKCQGVATNFTAYVSLRESNPGTHVPPSKDVLESGCKFVNCRLNCRKSIIVNKCQEAGFEQAKKLASAMAHTAKAFHKRAGGDPNNWPEACQADKIVEAHEY